LDVNNDTETDNVQLSLEHVSFNYLDAQIALKDITFSCRKGEKIAFLGANGCGKSTLQKILSGLIFPTTGRFMISGKEVNEKLLEDTGFNFWFRKRVGFIFQHSDAQLFSSSVREEIAFGPMQLGLAQDEVCQRVEDILNMLAITDLADRPPYKLSGGEKKKVAIASVLVMNPDILILDEPTNGLDPRTQRWLINLLYQLGQAGKTIIMATHQLNIVPEIADRVIVFNEQHEIAAEGSPAGILTNRDLLLQVNLIDPDFHAHWSHGGLQIHYHNPAALKR